MHQHQNVFIIDKQNMFTALEAWTSGRDSLLRPRSNYRKAEHKGCLIYLTLRGNRVLITCDNAVDDGEAHAGASLTDLVVKIAR